MIRALIRAVLTVVGTIGGLLCYFICQGMFAGYRKDHTDILSAVGMLLIMAVGGTAWIIDHRRIDADE